MVAIANSLLLRRCAQPGAVLRARLRGCSKPRTDPPGCSVPGTQGTAVPLINVEHHGDGTSEYTFGEASPVPPGSQRSPPDSHEAEPLHKVSKAEPPSVPTDSAAQQSEPRQSTASIEDTIQHQNGATADQIMEAHGEQDASQPVASQDTSGDGPLAGIPPPRRAYAMPTPREMKDQLNIASSRSEAAQMHTAVPDKSLAESPAVDSDSRQPGASSSAVEATTHAKAASPKGSQSSPVFQRMSLIGMVFCTALQEGNLASAVTIAHEIEEHGTEADWKVLAGPRFFRSATEARDPSAILSFLHALPPALPKTYTYQHAITACRALHDMAATLSVLEIMYERGTPPDAHHCSNALAVCKNGGEVEQAFVWFARMTAAGTTPDAHMLSALAATCSARIRTLRAEHKRAHSCDINVALQGIRRQQLVLADRAVGLLNLLPQTGRMADTALWNSILECVAFSGQLTRALQLLDDMSSEGCQPDSRTFVALLTACTSEGEKEMAQKVYRVALRNRCGTLRVQTAALGICLIRTEDSIAPHEENLSLARKIHRNVLDAGMPQDAVYKNKLIAAAGCSGDLKFALEIVAELRSSSKLSVTTDTASAAIRACVACGQPTQAFTLYKQFISEGVVPSVKSANQIMDSFAATGKMHAAVNVLEAAVAAGVVPNSGTIAALIGGCQRSSSFELAFQVAQAAVARGIPTDGVIGFLLLKTCYASLRMLWARTHAQMASQRATSHGSEDTNFSSNEGYGTSNPNPISLFNDTFADAVAAAQVDGAMRTAAYGVNTQAVLKEASESTGEWAGRMMHALTGRTSVTVWEEGSKSARDWRDRAHLVYRDLIANKVPITPRILERAIACMMLDVSRREKARTPQPQLAAPGLPPPPPPDPACTVIARLDGRFDPRAYKYIDDGAAAGRLPNTAVASGGRTVDLRGLLPATVEAFVLQLFHTLFRHLRGERGGSEAGGPARASGALALIVPPFRPGLVNMASSAPERHGLVDNWDDSAHGWSQSEDDMDDSFQTSDRVSQASRLRRLQRQHNIDLSAVTRSLPIDEINGAGSDGATSPVGVVMRGELVGFAAASALRSLKVPHIVEEASGVLVCDADDISGWAHRRHIKLLTRLQQRRRRRKSAEEMHAFASNSSDSEIDHFETDHHGRAHGKHSKGSRRGMSDDLKSGSLTPGLSGRGPSVPGGGLQGGLNNQTSTLRASSLHAQHMMHPPPLPDSTTCIWDKELSQDPTHSRNHTNGSHRTDTDAAPMHASNTESRGHMQERQGSTDEEVNGASVAPDMHASHAHVAEESHANGSSGDVRHPQRPQSQ